MYKLLFLLIFPSICFATIEEPEFARQTHLFRLPWGLQERERPQAIESLNIPLLYQLSVINPSLLPEQLPEVLARYTAQYLEEGFGPRMSKPVPPMQELPPTGVYRTNMRSPETELALSDKERIPDYLKLKLDALYRFATNVAPGEVDSRKFRRGLVLYGGTGSGSVFGWYEIFLHAATQGAQLATYGGTALTALLTVTLFQYFTDSRVQDPIKMRERYWRALSQYGLTNIPRSKSGRARYLAEKIHEAVGEYPTGYLCEKALSR